MSDRDVRKTVVLGASEHPWRYAHLAVNKLRAAGHPVVAIGKETGRIGDTIIHARQQDITGVHTVTIYLRRALQEQYHDYILGLRPQRIIFNPGAENNTLSGLASRQGIEVVNACTLVMLSTGQY
ncbi:MAG: CoA-binding protein [Saprospiraceae bacterium]|nr:CoA-binding protein [Saprospiraceae bacterium]